MLDRKILKICFDKGIEAYEQDEYLNEGQVVLTNKEIIMMGIDALKTELKFMRIGLADADDYMIRSVVWGK